MRVYRNSDGYIVTYTTSDVDHFGPSNPDTLFSIDGFFRYDRNGNLQAMDNHQPEGRALAAFAGHCREFAERFDQGGYCDTCAEVDHDVCSMTPGCPCCDNTRRTEAEQEQYFVRVEDTCCDLGRVGGKVYPGVAGPTEYPTHLIEHDLGGEG